MYWLRAECWPYFGIVNLYDLPRHFVGTLPPYLLTDWLSKELMAIDEQERKGGNLGLREGL